eukprot:m51a1_g13459 hypothetical protein (235) ;mRNA; r:883-1793
MLAYALEGAASRTVSAEEADREQEHRCLVCNACVVLKRGTVRAAHFSHAPETGAACELVNCARGGASRAPSTASAEPDIAADRLGRVHSAAVHVARRAVEEWVSGAGPAPPIRTHCLLCRCDRGPGNVLSGPPPRGATSVGEEVPLLGGKYRADIAATDANGRPVLVVEIVHTHKSAAERVLEILARVAPIVEVEAAALVLHGEWRCVYEVFADPSRGGREPLCPSHAPAEPVH